MRVPGNHLIERPVGWAPSPDQTAFASNGPDRPRSENSTSDRMATNNAPPHITAAGISNRVSVVTTMAAMTAKETMAHSPDCRRVIIFKDYLERRLRTPGFASSFMASFPYLFSGNISCCAGPVASTHLPETSSEDLRRERYGAGWAPYPKAPISQLLLVRPSAG